MSTRPVSLFIRGRRSGAGKRKCAAAFFSVLLAPVLLNSPLPANAKTGTAVEFVGERLRSRLLVHFEDVSSSEQIHTLHVVGVAPLGRVRPINLWLVSANRPEVSVLSAYPSVEWVVPATRSRVAGFRPNDPLLNEQWALQKMGVFDAWRAEKRDGTIRVAVVDTGVDASHPDLQDRVLPGLDLVNADDDASDDHGHGTHVAGIIAAERDNGLGVAGLSRDAVIVPFKACNASGACDDFLVIAGIVRAIQEGAKVVNLSLGGASAGCDAYELASDFAQRQGVLLVAAAGNSGAKDAGNPVVYPASCNGYLTVGATDQRDSRAPFSGHHPYVDISAPGVSIQSTVIPIGSMANGPDTYGYGPASGTSMAAPQVAGLAALLFAAHPEWTPAQVEARVKKTSRDLGKKGPDPSFGMGRIDVARAMGVVS